MKFFVYLPEHVDQTEYQKLIEKYCMASICDLDVAREMAVPAHEADYFLCPAYFFLVDGVQEAYNRLIPYLKYFPQYPERHIFFDQIDGEQVTDTISKAIVFKASATVHNTAMAGFYTVPTPLEDRLRHGFISPIEAARIDVSFMGTLRTHPVRQALPEAVESCRRRYLTVDYEEVQEYFYDRPKETREALANRYYRMIERSRFVLCPRGGGPSSHRFFETLACGRIPVLISDHLRLPLEGVLPWEEFCVRVPEQEFGRAGEYIIDFIERKDLIRAGQLAVQASRDYFDQMSINKFLKASLSEKKN